MENTERLWQGMFDGKLGVWQRADKLCFRTVAEGAEKCTLLLFEKGNEQEKRAVSMDRIGNSNVFSAEIAGGLAGIAQDNVTIKNSYD